MEVRGWVWLVLCAGWCCVLVGAAIWICAMPVSEFVQYFVPIAGRMTVNNACIPPHPLVCANLRTSTTSKTKNISWVLLCVPPSPTAPHPATRRAAMLEKSHGTREALEELLKRAVTYCPQAEILWLMAAKEAWLGGEVDKARNILSEAFAANPDNEDIWLAAFKLEFENQEPERARMILQKARDTETASTRRVWMKSAMVERELGNAEGERALLREGLQRFADFDKLHLMLGQLEERTGNVQGAGGMLSVWSAVGILPVLLFAMTLPHHRTPTIFVLPSVLQCENQKSISP